jgi:hypothetical protein
MPICSQRLKTVCLVRVLEHLHQRSVCCGSALEILDEVQQSNPVNQGYNKNKNNKERKKERKRGVCLQEFWVYME